MLLLHLLTSGSGTKRRRPRRRVYVSFWGVAEVHGRTASTASEAYDPKRALAGSKYCAAAICCRVEKCYPREKAEEGSSP